jgi:hypothetical protein
MLQRLRIYVYSDPTTRLEIPQIAPIPIFAICTPCPKKALLALTPESCLLTPGFSFFQSFQQ